MWRHPKATFRETGKKNDRGLSELVVDLEFEDQK
jgi:hypothetical protein